MSEKDPPRTEPQQRLDTDRLLERLIETREAISDDGRPDAVETQHTRGKWTARERIDYLADDGSFEELGMLSAPAPSTPETTEWTREDAPADGVITGTARIGGRPSVLIAFDYTVKGGSIGHVGSKKISRVLERSVERGLPVVFLHDGGGHRIQEGLDARPFAHGDIDAMFTKMTKLSGWVPMISAMLGPGFAGPTNFAAFCDFVPIVEEQATMGIAGPSLVKAALGIDLSKNELGGAQFHTTETGMADLACEDEAACLDAVKQFLGYLPRHAGADLPRTDQFDAPYQGTVEKLSEIIPADPKKSFDVHEILRGIVDQDSFFGLKPRFARNIVTGFARLGGHSVGIIANNPRFKAGTLDTDATNKASRFIDLCDAYDLPLAFFTDVPGFMPGPESEREGLARHSAKLVYQLGRATTPVMNIVLRRGYGLGYLAMAGGRNRNEVSAIWPTAEIAAMGIEGAINIIYRHEIESAADSEGKREELIEKFIDRTGALRAAEGTGIDKVIKPDETRDLLIDTIDRSTLRMEEDWPPKKHGIHPI